MSGRSVLIVGAGFAGAVHARTFAERGIRVHVIDRRAHIAGNAYDEITDEGVRIHRYGPHLFHTNNERVIDWFSRFAVLAAYEHKVEAEIPGNRFVPLPINRVTINDVFGLKLSNEHDVTEFLATQAEPQGAIENAYQYLLSKIGRTLTDLFFRPYTQKMWAMDLSELAPAVVQRVPVRLDDDDRYFPNHAFQVLPQGGYTKAFEQILDHPLISVELNQPFDKAMLPRFRHCFNSMAIDAFFDFAEGRLPYRSIRFHHRKEPRTYARGTRPVVNFTDAGKFTRETDWSRLPGHRRSGEDKTITMEEPCDYADNAFERYYPVKTSDGRHDLVYKTYMRLARKVANVTFIGRCGTYQYLDMHQVINQSLRHAEAWSDRLAAESRR